MKLFGSALVALIAVATVLALNYPGDVGVNTIVTQESSNPGGCLRNERPYKVDFVVTNYHNNQTNQSANVTFTSRVTENGNVVHSSTQNRVIAVDGSFSFAVWECARKHTTVSSILTLLDWSDSNNANNMDVNTLHIS